MNELPLDVKILIGLYSKRAWINLVLYDDEFKQFSYKNRGINLFVNQFTKIIDNNTHLFGYLNSINDGACYLIDYQDVKHVWYYKSKYHRENDLPAVINSYGDKYWYCNGKLHRKNDLPAVIYADGNKYWFYNNKNHRENDLPAVIYADGNKYWYCNDKIHRDNDLPAVICNSGSKYWYCNGKQHRENDLPSSMSDDYKHWYYKGQRHRGNFLPAVIHGNSKTYYYYGYNINYYSYLVGWFFVGAIGTGIIFLMNVIIIKKLLFG